jgi:hypothetical protein
MDHEKTTCPQNQVPLSTMIIIYGKEYSLNEISINYTSYTQTQKTIKIIHKKKKRRKKKRAHMKKQKKKN